MKALILAAGFGTRLKPYTDKTPKPLFSVSNSPVLEITINQLISAGCSGIIINTHHLSSNIEAFIHDREFPIPVLTRYETEILDTGGAIKNVSDFWDDQPFLVVNSDIVTDVDYKAVYQFHTSHSVPATLVLHDYPVFNHVSVDHKSLIKGFYLPEDPELQKLAFTGIQVLDPSVLPLIPENTVTSSIELYKTLIRNGTGVKAYTALCRWLDIGTPENYIRACRETMDPEALQLASGKECTSPPESVTLKGDGSDRTWYRIVSDNTSVILGDHGITPDSGLSEVRSFLAINNHLKNRQLPVPEIYHSDPFSGLVYMEDLGDTDLMSTINSTTDKGRIISHYKEVLKLLVRLSTEGAEGFDTSWTYQSERYDRNIIIHNECHYFINAFINGITGKTVNPDDLKSEFNLLADRVLENQYDGFMHRDFQSRNIMIKNGDWYVIDFQGGRLGPVQYDLASLLIDPYTGLSDDIQRELELFFTDKFSTRVTVDRHRFSEGYRYCKLTRNLQMLGAFGFLSRAKGKTSFENYIPAAVMTLKKSVQELSSDDFPKLKKIIEKI